MNAFRLVGDKEIAFGRKEVADAKKAETNVRKSDPKATAKAKEDADKAMMYLQRVIKEHPDTPWSKMAERELQTPLGFKWVEAYLPPPPRPGQPPTPQQRADMERQKKRSEAEKARAEEGLSELELRHFGRRSKLPRAQRKSDRWSAPMLNRRERVRCRPNSLDDFRLEFSN